MTAEKRVQNAIMTYLKNLGQRGEKVIVYRRQAGGYSYKKGIPDLYAIINGIHLEIEVKRPGGEMSPLQEKFRDLCSKLNIHWICADSVSDVQRCVEEILNLSIS